MGRQDRWEEEGTKEGGRESRIECVRAREGGGAVRHWW